MPITKFHEKNISAFGKLETIEGTYNAPAATDALPATTMTGSVTYETGNYTYLGDSLSRDEFTYQKDSYADFSIETPLQVLGILNPALTVAQAPMSAWLQSCGAFITVNGTTGAVTYNNNQVSNETVSIDYRKSSAEDLVNNKLFKFTGCRGLVDVSATIGELPLLKYNFKGNAANPEANPILTPNFGNQLVNVAPVIRQSTIVEARIVEFGEVLTDQVTLTGTFTPTNVGTLATITFSVAHGLTTGRKINVTGATDPLFNGDFVVTVTSATTVTYVMTGTPASTAGTLVVKVGGYFKTFCFSTLNAPNFFGFEYERYLTGCEEGFAKGAVPTDVNVTMLEDQAGSLSFDPDANISKFFTATLKFGIGAGKYITLNWSKLQISNVAEGKVARYFGRDVTFRNTGTSSIVLS